ncbi:MAG: biotin--[acetyl-CoA-carboxylase] ligase [Ignisphaera sp.]
MVIENEILKILLMSRDYVSGASIAKSLGVSRATVNRAIKRLVSRGFIVDVHPRLGYRLADLDDISHAYRYVEFVDTSLRYYIHYLDSCDSTQDVAHALASSGAPEGTVVIAEELRRGRGRMGRQWIASRGGLWLSIILKPKHLRNMHLLSLASSVAVAKAIKSLLGIEARVKWPNDVLVDEKKVAGILIEGVLEADQIRYIVLGVGVNVNNDLPSHLLDTATTLKSVVGSDIPRIPLLINIIKNIDIVYAKLRQGEGKEVLDEWRRLSSTIGRRVKVITFSQEIEGIAEDIEDDGALRIRTKENSISRVYVGDVIHLRNIA